MDKETVYGVLFQDAKLDLHGMNYEDAERAVIRFVEDHWDRKTRLEIVTGHSTFMKGIVIKVLDEYKLSYEVGSQFDHNKGYIVTWTS